MKGFQLLCTKTLGPVEFIGRSLMNGETRKTVFNVEKMGSGGMMVSREKEENTITKGTERRNQGDTTFG